MTVACPRCFRVSHSPADQENRYCGACHLFWGDARLIVRHGPTSAEFDCVGCDAHVYSIGHKDETATCAVCTFLREQVEAETMTTAEALQMRELLQRHVEASR
jgi:hypothetical protein